MRLHAITSEVSGQIGNAIIDNPKVALLVPTVTAAIAPITKMAEIQGYLSIISMCIGIIVSLVLLRHRWVMLKKSELEFREASKKYEAD
jgi:hypothetical protein